MRMGVSMRLIDTPHLVEGSSVSTYEISGSFDIAVAEIMSSIVIQESILIRKNLAPIERSSVCCNPKSYSFA